MLGFGRRRPRPPPSLMELHAQISHQRRELELEREKNQRLLNYQHELEMELSQRPEVNARGDLADRLAKLLPGFRITVRVLSRPSRNHPSSSETVPWEERWFVSAEKVAAIRALSPGELTLEAEAADPLALEKLLYELAVKADVIVP